MSPEARQNNRASLKGAKKMKPTMLFVLFPTLALFVCQASVNGDTPVGTAFTYQGRLDLNGTPVSQPP